MKPEFEVGEDEVTRLASVRAGWRDPGAGLVADVGYRISNDTSRVLSRQIVFVGIGQGRYDIEGNPVGPGRGDYDLLYTPSDSTVTRILTGMRQSKARRRARNTPPMMISSARSSGYSARPILRRLIG